MSSTKAEIVLAGAGHTHLHILRMWGKRPIPNARLTCISDFPWATYSGMLPATLAGLYPPEKMTIDLPRLCARVGARFIEGTQLELDVPKRCVHIESSPPIPFDVLSIGIGSQPSELEATIEPGAAVPIKPMQTFIARFEQRVGESSGAGSDRPLRVSVVGAGAAGVEVTLCLSAKLRDLLLARPFEITLVDKHHAPGGELGERASQRIERLLKQRDVKLKLGQAARSVDRSGIELADGARLPSDVNIWVTGAAPADPLYLMDLPKDERGFLLTRSTLQTLADAPIFAVGDTGTISGGDVPKAGVYAVRQGPVLWKNIAQLVKQQPLKEFRPQSRFLKLLCTGDGKALLSYRNFAFHARWCWWLKDWIDGGFVEKYQVG